MPVIVSVKVPLRAFFAVFRVKRAVPLPEGAKLPETPLGRPLTLQVTAPLNS